MGMAKKPASSTPKTAKAAVSALVGGVALSLILAGCSWDDSRSEKLGTVVGGVVGGILGSKVGGGTGKNVAIVIGATLGAMWGKDIAKGLTEEDQVFSQRTTQDTLEYGKPGERVSWSNPDSGNSGSVTPDEVYTSQDGQDCREFETTVQVEGEERTAMGTACRNADGEWQVVDAPEQTT